MDEWTEDYLEDVFLRDLDGTGSMHPCSSYDEGAVRYAPRAQFRCDVNSACRQMQYAITQFCNNALITRTQKKRLMEIARIGDRALTTKEAGQS